MSEPKLDPTTCYRLLRMVSDGSDAGALRVAVEQLCGYDREVVKLRAEADLVKSQVPPHMLPQFEGELYRAIEILAAAWYDAHPEVSRPLRCGQSL